MNAAAGFERLAELERSDQAFALATVVGRRAPVSASLGDRAVVFPDGRMEGFVGGACARDIVRKRALEALRRGRALLLAIRPGLVTESVDEGDEIERIVVPMGCASEGHIDIYIEPHLSKRHLVVVGFTPVTDALARIAATLEFRITRFVLAEEVSLVEAGPYEVRELDQLGNLLDGLENETLRLAAVVASQGHYDESALEKLLDVPVGFLGVLASRKRMAAIRGSLAQGGVEEDRLERIYNPVGLDIGASGPSEIALTILAQVVALTPRVVPAGELSTEKLSSNGELVVDPVCGMEFAVSEAAAKREHAGTELYFCCEGCARRFAAEPERFVTALERA